MDSNYTKAGYLTEPFKIFHLRDEHKLNIDFHYHDAESRFAFLVE